VLLSAASVLLAACVEEESGRQFASDPRPTPLPETPTAVVTPPPPPPTLPVVAARPLSDVLRPRGAPARVYFRAGRELWTMAADGTGVARVFAPPPGSSIAGVSASPAGDRAAVLVQTATGADAIVFDAAGIPELRAGNLGAAFGAPGRRAARTIDWSPQGNELVVGIDPGGLLALPLIAGDEVRVIAMVDGVGVARWSPTGQAVAFEATPAGDGFRQLNLVDATAAAPGIDGPAAATPVVLTSDATVVGADSGSASPEPGIGTPDGGDPTTGATPVGPPPAATPAGATPLAEEAVGSAIVPAQPDRAVYEFAWMPDGRAIVFVEGGVNGEGPASADLWRAAVPGGERSLITSAGSVAPVARVGIVAPSPDGAALAYTVGVPDAAATRFQSLWVLELASRQATQLDVPAGLAVREVWWTGNGLLYRAEPETPAGGSSGGAFALYRVVGEDPAEVIFQAVEAATPVPAASPVASPETPPAPSPRATPQPKG
jgi:hypothetical protein